MIINKFVFLVLLAVVTQSHGQVGKKIKTLEISDTIRSMTIDRPGDIYIITKSGQLQKFDKDGHLLILKKDSVPPTLFDPHDGARLFAYYRNAQQYIFMNSSFQISSAYQIDSAFVIQPWLMCPSGDLHLWVLDAADHSLKRVSARNTEVQVEVEIDLTLIKDVRRIDTMRDYQGFVFLHEPGVGLHIFNRLGKHIRTLTIPTLTTFNFLGEELYYIHGDTLKYFDIFTGETRETPLPPGHHDVLIGEDRLFARKKLSLDIFEFRP